MRVLAGSVLGIGIALAGPGNGALAASSAIRIVYEKPKDAAHRPIYETLRQSRILERIRDHIAGVSLPRKLTIKVEGCDGDINAAYEPSDTTLSICYEYLAYIQELAQDIPPALAAEGLTPANYVIGPFLEVVLHELAHALFDLKKIPILGREEDAADQVAAYTLLLMGPKQARRALASIAAMYAGEAKDQTPGLKEFADEHGLSAQRFYNLLCLAFGADPKAYGDLVAKGYLPKERAEQCAGEFRQVQFAVRKLIAPHVKRMTLPGGVKPGAKA